jgi:hypothetical protein
MLTTQWVERAWEIAVLCRRTRLFDEKKCRGPWKNISGGRKLFRLTVIRAVDISGGDVNSLSPDDVAGG